jgi:hypothetical protein
LLWNHNAHDSDWLVSHSGQMTGKPEVIGSSVGLVTTNALVLTGVANFRGRQLLPGLFPKLSFPEYAWMGALPTIRSHVNKAKRDVRAELIALSRGHISSSCPGASRTWKRMISWPPTLESVQPVRRAVNSQKLCLPDTPHSPTRPLNFLWYAITTYKPLKHLSLAAPLSA